ncbi:thiol reductase thioredoxin [Nocardia amamiensis]|uniref:Thiol reductase thioredoxin n=1 Tax=Nocardia amamiensis TaxID=404578 RepID=A0ABS0D0Y9_9NOCA|nr:thioredoxin domain-containing protein [Nocardia amamiensis]MBF6302484.1 thiol reductase thioredoxin [Nocardia amamiensis]
MPTITLTQHNFDSVVASNPIVLVDWWAGWCGPCHRFAPVYEASSDRHPEIVHGKVDTEAEVALSAGAQVTQYPTLMAFREGLLVYSEAGALTPDALEDLVQQILWLDMDQIRRRLAEQDARELATTGASATARRAGPAPVSPRYGWPGL